MSKLTRSLTAYLVLVGALVCVIEAACEPGSSVNVSDLPPDAITLEQLLEFQRMTKVPAPEEEPAEEIVEELDEPTESTCECANMPEQNEIEVDKKELTSTLAGSSLAAKYRFVTVAIPIESDEVMLEDDVASLSATSDKVKISDQPKMMTDGAQEKAPAPVKVETESQEPSSPVVEEEIKKSGKKKMAKPTKKQRSKRESKGEKSRSSKTDKKSKKSSSKENKRKGRK